MRPEIVLILSLTGLGAGIACARWLAVAPLLLAADLQDARARLDARAAAEGRRDDPDHRAVRARIGELVAVLRGPYPFPRERRAARRLVRDVRAYLDGEAPAIGV